jgi:GT2 family glycosyltransferase
VIPSFNHAPDAITAIASLREAEPRPGRVIFVDDASSENAVEEISRWASTQQIPWRLLPENQTLPPVDALPWLTIIASAKNGGFVRCANLGIRFVRDHTDHSYLLLMNNDAAVAPDYFRELSRAIVSCPEVGVLSGAIYEWDRVTVWYAGGRFNPLRALASHDTRLPDGDAPRDTGYVCGCTMLISRAVVQKIGVLAESFSPCYVEDVDYSLRARAAGFRVMLAPKALSYHRVGTSLGRSRQSPRTIFSFNRNRALALRRNYRGARRAIGLGYLVVTKPGRALWELVRARPATASAVIRGMLAGLFGSLADREEAGTNRPAPGVTTTSAKTDVTARLGARKAEGLQP